MNEIIDRMIELDRFLIDKLSTMKNQSYLKAVAEAKELLSKAETIIALANGKGG